MQILFVHGMNFHPYQKIKARDMDIAISIITVSCQRKTRAYHACLDLVDTMSALRTLHVKMKKFRKMSI